MMARNNNDELVLKVDKDDFILKPLNKRPIMQNNHCDHIDRDGSLRSERKDRQRLGKSRASISSYKGKYSLNHRVRKKSTTPEEQCISNLKMILQCYNVFILILGCGVLGVGVWLLVKEFNTREMSAIMGSRLVEMITYGLIAGGGAATILAFCGCCGTMKQEKFVLGFYGTILTLVLITLCVGFGVSFIFKDDITEGIKTKFETTIMFNYGNDIQRNSTNKLITDAWDSMQSSLGCCGAYGDVNNEHSWGLYKTQSIWFKRYKPDVYVPDSCCVDGEDKHLCQGDNNKYDGPPVYGPPNSKYRTHKDNQALYTTGCYDKALAYLEQHFLIITIVTGSVPLLLLIGIVIAFYLCANVRDTDDDDDFDYEVEV
ncbi:CD82 antigen-like isoform X2 [Mercenaria mercenaria]|uniref:CD82 antigen-like isoform X2 n=1 Tax=Mercenaria mercenaria TaxID=6596 RepID=UPI00234F2684|nr:CD82 antigen-like isoform X2 [Mercenaria mercenaria]